MRALLLTTLLVGSNALATEPQWIAAVGRGAESANTDIVRLGYRHPLKEHIEWWRPSHVQLGASIWRVPDLGGRTRRFDLNATAIWRDQRPWGYFEAGFGGYLLSRSIHNDETSVPSGLEFGSHIGIGLRIGKGTLGLGLQHISNAGIKRPNGGIDLVLIQYGKDTR